MAFVLGPMAPPHQHYGFVPVLIFLRPISSHMVPFLRLVALVGALWNLGFDGHEGVCASASQDCLGSVPVNVYFLDTIYVVTGVGW